MPSGNVSGGKPLKRFADFDEGSFDTPLHVPLEDILDKDVIVHDCREREGQYSDFLVLLCEDPEQDGTRFTTTVGGKVVCRKIKEAKELGRLPLIGRIIRPGRYYDIV